MLTLSWSPTLSNCLETIVMWKTCEDNYSLFGIAMLTLHCYLVTLLNVSSTFAIKKKKSGTCSFDRRFSGK